MKKHLIISFTVICISIVALIILLSSPKKNSHIIESNTITSVMQYVDDENTLVIFDIDNTIAHTKQEVGSDEWFSYLLNEQIKKGYDYLSATYMILPRIYYALFNVSLQLIENSSPQLLKNLKNNNIPTIALTTRSLHAAEQTKVQLNNINIGFYFPYTKSEEFLLPMPFPCIYKDDIIFCGNNDKGNTLLCFLDTIGYKPKQVIFIDDKLKNIQSVETALTRRGIPFVGIRYSGSDKDVLTFNPAKAEKQYIQLKQHKTATP